MDTTAILIAIGVVAIVALYLYNRNKPAPHGTYDDKKLRSDGSIGGGTRAHDDPTMRSSGSIGGAAPGDDRSYDSPDHRSGGSIGGRQQSENVPTSNRSANGNRFEERKTNEQEEAERESHTRGRSSTLPRLDGRSEAVATSTEQVQRNNRVRGERDASNLDESDDEQKRKEEFRSGGSFGGSQRS